MPADQLPSVNEPPIATATRVTARAAAPTFLRRFRVRLMSGDEAAFELDTAKCIRDLKRLIASERVLGSPPIARQRLVLMPAHGGREPHEVLADGRALAQCGHAVGDETELELVVVDAPVEVPVISEVLPYLFNRFRSPIECCCY